MEDTKKERDDEERGMTEETKASECDGGVKLSGKSSAVASWRRADLIIRSLWSSPELRSWASVISDLNK